MRRTKTATDRRKHPAERNSSFAQFPQQEHVAFRHRKIEKVATLEKSLKFTESTWRLTRRPWPLNYNDAIPFIPGERGALR